MNDYQRLYIQLFELVIVGWGLGDEADQLSKRLDELGGTHHQKQQWGEEVGWLLYEKAIQP